MSCGVEIQGGKSTRKDSVRFFYKGFEKAECGFVEVEGALYAEELKTMRRKCSKLFSTRKAAKQTKTSYLQAIGNTTISHA